LFVDKKTEAGGMMDKREKRKKQRTMVKAPPLERIFVKG